MNRTVHVPILVQPIVENLLEPFLALPENGDPCWLVDCTLGGGGHTAAFLAAFASHPRLRRHRVLALDQDPAAVARGTERFAAEIAQGRLEIRQARFSQAAEVLEGRRVLGLMADLGFSSDQLEDPARGLSFLADGPLDMRMDPSRGKSCRQWLQEMNEQEIARVLHELGEERFSRKIAHSIALAKSRGALLSTTAELEEIVFRAFPPAARHGRIHPATRTFQALRIWVNDEMNELDTLLGSVILSVEGRVAILSFHSLEDRKVKHAFKGKRGEASPFRALSKKPVEASEDEVRANPRSRSAKLRIAERTAD